MKHLLRICLLGAGLTACSTSPLSAPSNPPPAPPDDGVLECLKAPNNAQSTAQRVDFGERVQVTSGERWYGAEVAAGTYTLTIEGLFPYYAFFYAIYQETFAPIEAESTREFTPRFTNTFEAEEGVLLVEVYHMLPLGQETCETYTLTLEATP